MTMKHNYRKQKVSDSTILAKSYEKKYDTSGTKQKNESLVEARDDIGDQKLES